MSPHPSVQPAIHRVTYRNAMESLVTLEVDQQLRCMAPRVAKLFNRKEVIAFALNRLPTLYATSERGWRQQLIKGRRDLSDQISTAVQQGLMAVQRDPLRCDAPLNHQEEQEVAIALQHLQVLLNSQALTLKNLPDLVEQALVQAKPLSNPLPTARAGHQTV